jgi:CheY-like chemotaxis protein
VRSVDLGTVVAAAIDAVRPAAHAKRIEIAVGVDPDATRMVGDPDRIQQVIWNLAQNAIKFTPRGGRVEVRLLRNGSHIELVVSDDGEGIEAGFLPHVFDRFRQAQGSITRRHGGLGLGLALVRCLVEAHGGTVRAESAGLGRGATFTVSFPAPEDVIRLSDRPRRQSSSTMPAADSVSGVNVLVVDDEPDARDLIETVLRMNGAEVTTAPSAERALELISAQPPMVLISDIGMPGMDGYELMRKLRTEFNGKAARLPAIALTAYTREEDRRRAEAAGFQAHVAKPFEPAELLRLVSSLAWQRSPPSSRSAQA